MECDKQNDQALWKFDKKCYYPYFATVLQKKKAGTEECLH